MMTGKIESASSLPLVSVIVATYNYGHLIGQTLESTQAQTYQNWECIVIDDGSTDNTSKVVACYKEKDDRIKYIHQKNRGQAAAKNNGIRNSAGKYLQFLDADDLIESKKFERQVEYLEQHPEVDIIYGSVRYFSTENTDERLYSMWGGNRPWMPEVSGQGEDILLALSGGNIMAVNSALIRRSIIDDVGLFDEMAPPLEDWDYWIRCAARGKRFQYAGFEGTLALVRSHPSSSSRNKRRMVTAMSLIQKKVGAATTGAGSQRINRGIAAQIDGLIGVYEVTNGSLLKGIWRLVKAGAKGGKIKWRMKWLLCAFIAPFVPRQHLGKVVSFSIIQFAAGVFRKPKRKVHIPLR